jgi:hypothetical protein
LNYRLWLVGDALYGTKSDEGVGWYGILQQVRLQWSMMRLQSDFPQRRPNVSLTCSTASTSSFQNTEAAIRVAERPGSLGGVSEFGHKCDVPPVLRNVRFQG